jgi:hypothetical protein
LSATFKPQTSSFHYRLASLMYSFSFDKPRTLCGYVFAVLAPLFLGVILAVASLLTVLSVGAGLLLLLGPYEGNTWAVSAALVALGLVMAFFTLLMGSFYNTQTAIGRFCDAAMRAICSAFGAGVDKIRLPVCRTVVAYDMESPR